MRSPRFKRIFGSILMISSLVFGLIETACFGNNLFPSGTAELICDLIAVTMFVAGASMFFKKP